MILNIVVGAMFCVVGNAIESNGDSQLTSSYFFALYLGSQDLQSFYPIKEAQSSVSQR